MSSVAAYDSIWREGLMVKLYNMGIKDKIWRWINNFLSGRIARCILGDFLGEEFETKIDLQQGSVISPPYRSNAFVVECFFLNPSWVRSISLFLSIYATSLSMITRSINLHIMQVRLMGLFDEVE
jgi:hypothetical protein